MSQCRVRLDSQVKASMANFAQPIGKKSARRYLANGYVRGETVGVFFVQQARHARRIYCKVTHVKISADGYKSEGFSSLAKVILAMETGIIAGNLHFNQPNPDIPSLHDGTIEIVGKATPFPGGPQTIHCIEKEAPYPDSGYALLNMVGQRSAAQFPYRGYMLVPVDGCGKEVIKDMTETRSRKRPVWFIFTGVGCQWKGMAQQMMQFHVFARSIQRSHEILKEVGMDLIDALISTNDDGGVGPLYGCIAAVQVALVDVLRAMGIRPDGMVGHSLGEVGCAYADECLTAQQTVLCAYWRGRCVDTGNLPPGAMAAVGLTWEEATKRCPDGVQPACHNAEDSVTVSGAVDAVAKWVEELTAEGVIVREVNSAGVAFHSKYMESIRPAFVEAMQKIITEPKRRSKRWLSSSLPPHRWQDPLAERFTPEYHVNNIASPVLFFEALQHVPEDAILIEVAPHCLLQSVLRRSVGTEAACLGLMKRDADNVDFFLNSLGQLHLLGVKFDPSLLYPPLPLPVPRGTPNIGHLVSWDHSQQWAVVKWNDFPTSDKLSEEVVEIDLDDLEGDAYLAGHQLHGRVVLPATGCIVMAWKSLAKRLGKPFEELSVVLEDLEFHRVVILPKTGSVRFLVNVMRASGEFEISEGGMVVASGTIRPGEENETILDQEPLSSPTETLTYEVDAEDIYKELRLRGYEYDGPFLGILKADIQRPCGKMRWSGNWVAFIDSMLQITVPFSAKRVFKLPARIQSCCIDPNVHAKFFEKANESGIDVVYDDYFNMIQAGGIAVKGLKTSTLTTRTIDHTPIVNEYHFVPYVDSDSAKQGRQALIQDYVDLCTDMARRLLKKLSNVLGRPVQCDHLPRETFQSILDNNVGNHGLLKVLTVVEEQAEKSASSLEDLLESVVSTYKKELETDIITTALFEEEPLRHLLDVVVENTSLKSLQVLEIAAPGTHYILAPRIFSLSVMSNMLLKLDYTITQHPTDNLLLENFTEFSKIVKWDPMSDTNEKLHEADLTVACFGPWSTHSPYILADKLSKLCKEQGFALISHRTAVTPAERVISAIAKHEFAVHTIEGMERLLQSHGFQLVGRKSNTVSALLLLRKTAVTVEAAKPLLVRVNNAKYDWVEVLKAKALEVEQKPPGHNLWLLAEDCGISGVVGLTNCLRLETGGSHIR
ncbi:fatty acid synthase-like [Rhipicephalus sanguineus]|uniref:fatty acid synthase-like n=1 Tax=Rhipicephalus sanguineus TaxID=34632 RepID=UPI0020C56EF9|nr:fatty acid synthase-like [Rhipicephalus sanguineus]